MKFIRRMVVLFVVMAALLLTGDYLNLPLWPIDYLASNFPVEIQIDLNSLSEEQRERLLARSQIIQLEILDPGGELIRDAGFDNRGIARIVLPRGRYRFELSIPVVDKDEWYFLVYPPRIDEPIPLQRVSTGGLSVSIVPEISRNIPDADIARVIQLYLLDGDITSAGVIAFAIPVTARRRIHRLAEIVQELESLPVDAYNSILSKLDESRRILSSFELPGKQQLLKVNSQNVFIESRYEAVRQARNRVVNEYLDLMQMQYDAGNLIVVFQHWNQLTGNSELFNPSLLNETGITEKFRQFETLLSDYSDLIPQEVSQNLSQAIGLYESGNLMKARTSFVELLAIIRDLSHLPENYATRQLIIEYIKDIELISEANHAIRMDQLDRALLLYDSVRRPNDLVQERINETKRFMQLQGGQALTYE